MPRIAVVQPALALGEVERNLARIDELIRDAHREHHADVIVVPEACTSPNVYARVLRDARAPGRRAALPAAHAALARARLRSGRRIPGQARAPRLRHLRPRRAQRRGASARQGHPDRLGAELLPRRRRRGPRRVRGARRDRRPDVGLGVGAQPHRGTRSRGRRPARDRRHVLAVDAAQLARPAALVG